MKYQKPYSRCFGETLPSALGICIANGSIANSIIGVNCMSNGTGARGASCYTQGDSASGTGCAANGNSPTGYGCQSGYDAGAPGCGSGLVPRV